ncbi:MAG TPA: flagellar basal body rod protein FlgB [Arcobacter sp.]|nr:flagellar basal body rod protein FlgB [Arcobacter sp.]HIP55938.1 flagellar basal body rod protein FlgB [Arcobacter sp.]
MTASNVTNLLFEQLKNRGDNQKIIASNIANLNTPNYKTKALSFEQHLEKTQNTSELKLSTTHSNHISFNDEVDKKTTGNTVYEVSGLEEQNDGNNVNLDTQMSEMAKNSVMYNAITNSIKKDAQWFKLMVDASGKN